MIENSENFCLYRCRELNNMPRNVVFFFVIPVPFTLEILYARVPIDYKKTPCVPIYNNIFVTRLLAGLFTLSLLSTDVHQRLLIRRTKWFLSQMSCLKT